MKKDYLMILIEALKETLPEGIPYSDIICVWFSKTIENSKGLFIVGEGNAYYEVTYHGKRNVTYVDTYLKLQHKEVANEKQNN
ncbi:DUF6275 family protein [Lactococcus petauri]|uniref:DUF6275 family protein n=1 Tax=Lactococcus petauri TaxID=1940789 RepID=UPI0021183375|nr:DUF6275 family protein [Lactococcus petauri]MCQ8276814.1 hypothetical protein [Lactococcus petauri]MCR6590486.1 DUF6275 family protein [Lactococcus petauri]